MRPWGALAIAAAAACAAPAVPPRSAVAPMRGDLGLFTSDDPLHRSYWLRTDGGVIGVAPDPDPVEGRVALSEVGRILGGPVLGLVLLDPTPARIEGAFSLRRTVWTSSVTANHLALAGRDVEPLPQAWPRWHSAPAWPLAIPLAGGHVAIAVGGHLFTSDLIASGCHPGFAADLDALEAGIARAAQARPRVVHPGCGPSGGPEILAEAQRYIDALRTARRAHPGDAQAIAAALRAQFPKHRGAIDLTRRLGALVAR